MSDITNYMYDTSYIEEVINYLETSHEVYSVILDSNGDRLPIGDNLNFKSDKEQYFPFSFHEDIGGFLCGAKSIDILEFSSPHIQICINGINNILQRELEFSQSSEEMLRLSDQINFLFNLADKVIGITKLKDFCSIIFKEISEAILADFALIETKAGSEEESIKIYYNISEEKAEEIKSKKSFQSMNKNSTILFSLDDGTSVIIAPIKKKDDKENNYMSFFRHKENRFFTSYEKKFVSIIDNIISPNLESLRLFDSLQHLYLNTVKALAAAIDAKDEYTHGHSFRVGKYSVIIGKKMNITGNELADLEIAAYMHDLGKIGVPEHILGKTGALTPEEFTEIKKHPVFTQKILKPIHLPSFIIEAAVHHHERLDGRGYPSGLKGDEIPLFARVIAVADVFDALTSSRPYRSAMSVENALKLLCNGIDKDFDKKVVLALITALEDEKDQKPLSNIHPDLKYSDVHHMNQFLVGLTEMLLNRKKE